MCFTVQINAPFSPDSAFAVCYDSRRHALMATDHAPRSVVPRTGLRAAVRSTLRTEIADPSNLELYTEAALGIFIAGLIVAGCIALGIVLAPTSDPAQLWATVFVGHGVVHLTMAAVFFGVWQVVRHCASRGNLRYFVGTLCNVIGFTIIIGYVAAVVHVTGGIRNSIFSSPLISLIGVAVIVPRSYGLKVLLFFSTLVVLIVLLFYERPSWPEKVLIVSYSVFAYFYAFVIKYAQSTGVSAAARNNHESQPKNPQAAS